jgi:hypothetical protein
LQLINENRIGKTELSRAAHCDERFFSHKRKLSDIEHPFSCVRRDGSIDSNMTHTGAMIHGKTDGSAARSIQQTLRPAALVNVWCLLVPP